MIDLGICNLHLWMRGLNNQCFNEFGVSHNSELSHFTRLECPLISCHFLPEISLSVIPTYSHKRSSIQVISLNSQKYLLCQNHSTWTPYYSSLSLLPLCTCSICGTLHSVDQFLNIKLTDISVTDPDKYPHMVGSIDEIIMHFIVLIAELDDFPLSVPVFNVLSAVSEDLFYQRFSSALCSTTSWWMWHSTSPRRSQERSLTEQAAIVKKKTVLKTNLCVEVSLLFCIH